MIEAWTTDFTAADMFRLLDDYGYTWGRIYLYAASSFTQYKVWLGPLETIETIPTVFFPLQWTRACLSLDSIASKVRLVVDGQLLVEEEYRREEDKYRPANLSRVLGYNPATGTEYPFKITDLNMFNSSSSVEHIEVGNLKWTKPYRQEKDTRFGDAYNCMAVFTDEDWNDSWNEWQCETYDQSCPCSYPTQPLLILRGLCSPLIDNLFSPKQLEVGALRHFLSDFRQDCNQSW